MDLAEPVQLTWRDRLGGAAFVAAAYFLGSIPLAFFFGAAALVGAFLFPPLFVIPYVILPLPALLALAALRHANARFGKVSLPVLSLSCMGAILALCLSMTNKGMPSSYEILIWPASAAIDMFLDGVDSGGPGIRVVIAGAAFLGAFVASFWRTDVRRSK